MMCKFRIKLALKPFHFNSVLLGVIAILLLVLGVLDLQSLFSSEKLATKDLLNYVGVFFSVTGLVTALYFIIMGVFTYRTQREIEKVVAQMEISTDAVNQYSNTIYNTLYNFFSEQINEDRTNAAKYKLFQERLACLLKNIDQGKRENQIRQLGSTERTNPNTLDIKNDIELLNHIVYDDTENPNIRKAAKDARDDLKKKLKEIEKSE